MKYLIISNINHIVATTECGDKDELQKILNTIDDIVNVTVYEVACKIKLKKQPSIVIEDNEE